MALNLKMNDGDRAVSHCSDESGSDCSSEELIDCDVIVDVTTVTGTDNETKTNTSPKKTDIAIIKREENGNHIKQGQDHTQLSNVNLESLTIKNDALRDVNPTQLLEDKVSSCITSLNPKKKRRVNFNLTIDIAKAPLNCDRECGEQCVPQYPSGILPSYRGGPGSTDFTDIESLSEPIPTTPGGKPQVNLYFGFSLKLNRILIYLLFYILWYFDILFTIIIF